MDTVIQIAKDSFWVGANDRETDLFEAVWPLPQGVSYNAYLIADKKTALIDTVKNCYFERYLEKIHDRLPQGKGIDYLVINHMEPDHSGSINLLRQVYPEMTVVGNKKTIHFLEKFYGITENTLIKDEGDELSLGSHTLSFSLIPMVHWPETMVTYDKSSGVLYTGDAFGGFGALEGSIFAEELDIPYIQTEILRYFSNIVGKYSPMVQRALKKLQGLNIATIAPSHGPVWRKNPTQIIDLYDRWSRYEAEEGIVLIYGSMYGNTLKLKEEIDRGIVARKFSTIRTHDISRSHPSYILTDVWRYKGIIIGAPTYNTGLFPPMDYLLRLLENKKLKNRVLGIFGSYAWSGGAVKRLRGFADNMSWHTVEPVVEVQGNPSPDELHKGYKLGRNVTDAIKNA